MSQSARRAIQVLEFVINAHAPVGLMQVADDLHIDKSTAARTLSVLESESLLHRDSSSKAYSAGRRLLSMSVQVLSRLDLRRVARPLLEEFATLTGETVSLHVRVGDTRLCVDGVESTQAIRRVVPFGESAPLPSGPAGKVILAYLPPDECRRILTFYLTPAQVRTVTQQLDLVVRNGYMAAIGDRSPGAGALAGAVLVNGRPVASVTAAGPGDRWTVERMKAFHAPLREILEQLGAVPISAMLRDPQIGAE